MLITTLVSNRFKKITNFLILVVKSIVISIIFNRVHLLSFLSFGKIAGSAFLLPDKQEFYSIYTGFSKVIKRYMGIFANHSIREDFFCCSGVGIGSFISFIIKRF